VIGLTGGQRRDSVGATPPMGMSMAHFFRQPDRRQRFLLPVDMMD
jgi:hypothetical protein